ncbi:MAG: hypothetical protein LAP38_04365 [Acidobacteriia bacterium]|nr:hypothetical protein [Terriglobia bacterium]
MAGGIEGNPFVVVEFEEGGRVFEVAALALAAVALDLAEMVESFLELAGEALALDGEVIDEAMGVDDVEGHFLINDSGWFVGRIGGAVQDVGFEQRDAVEAPGGIGQLVDELGFGVSCRLVFVKEGAAVGFVDGGVFRRQDGGCGGEAVAEGVQRRALLAGFGAGAGGVLGVGAVDGAAADGGESCS